MRLAPGLAVLALLLSAVLPAVALAEPARAGFSAAASVNAGGLLTIGDDDSPAGRTLGATLRLADFFSPRSATTAEVSWSTLRDTVYDPFESVPSDLRIHLVTAALGLQRYVGSRVWLNPRLTVTYATAHDLGPAMRDYQDGFAFGVGARLGVAVYQTEHGAVALVAEGQILLGGAPATGATGSVGLEYQWWRTHSR
ncbi:MAG: hypothetical protein K8W52_43515 [Deltaproteobacteria bacterium]|nr:hypothetical protein [Deltaproteobacteria bacterium]